MFSEFSKRRNVKSGTGLEVAATIVTNTAGGSSCLTVFTPFKTFNRFAPFKTHWLDAKERSYTFREYSKRRNSRVLAPAMDGAVDRLDVFAITKTWK